MKCPECVKEGKKSRVMPGISTRTCMYAPPGYYNEDGEWVNIPDPNKTTTQYRCSEGHDFQETR